MSAVPPSQEPTPAPRDSLARGLGALGVVFADLYTTLLPEALNVIGVDGLHPTEAGYRRIAEVFFTAIASTLEQ